MNYGKRRDANEQGIVQALRAVGARVQRLNESGVPDLLVQFRGVLTLLEVKDVRDGHATPTRRNQGDHASLTPAQAAWWAAWGEPAPTIVMTAEQAIEAIGARVHSGPVGITPTPEPEALQQPVAQPVAHAEGRSQLGQGRKVRGRRR